MKVIKEPGSLPDAVVRELAQIHIANTGMKKVASLGQLQSFDFLIDARGLPDAAGGMGKYKTLEDQIEAGTTLSRHVDTLLEAIHKIPDRRWQKGPNWYHEPIRVLCVCAWGVHRSRGLRNLLHRELLALGYNIQVIQP